MRRIVHLSDLHFGHSRSELVEPLVAAVSALRPDLVAVSGDLTQRARPRQFAAARAFLDRLSAPWLAVPGNHDIPLENLALRLIAPWRRYRQAIAAELEPLCAGGGVAVVGINTADPLAWQRGRVRARSLAHACGRLRAAGSERVGIVLAHHPFEHLPGERKALMRGAAAALGALAQSGADVVLSGHLHTWRAAPFALPQRAGVLQVQAGSGLARRLRDEANDFNLLTVDADAIGIERFAALPGGTRFVPAAACRFRRGADGRWRPACG